MITKELPIKKSYSSQLRPTHEENSSKLKPIKEMENYNKTHSPLVASTFKVLFQNNDEFKIPTRLEKCFLNLFIIHNILN